MSNHALEIAIIQLKPGTDLEVGETGKIWSETLDTIKSQQGCKGVYWGRQIEHPDTAQLLVDWDTHAHHLQFIASPLYQPFLARAALLTTSPPQIYHLKLPTQDAFLRPCTAPVTECISLFFEPTYPTTRYDDNWQKFAEEGGKSATEAQGLTGGWAVEGQRSEEMAEKMEGREDAKLFGAFIGWPSVQAHLAYREDPAFPKTIKHLREGPKVLAVHHVAFKKW